MVEPILASGNTWWAPTNSAVTRASITEIEIKDSYTPDASVTVTDSWDASAAKDGSVMCYVIGAKLIIAGNGSGKVYLNKASNSTFGSTWDTNAMFVNLTDFRTNYVLDASKCTSMIGIFGGMKVLTSLDLKHLNVSNVTRFSSAFQLCYELQNIDVSDWDVSNSTTMEAMFSMCKKLQTINISKWRLTKCTSVQSMFYGCISLVSLDIADIDVSNVTNFSKMFNMADTNIDVGECMLTHVDVSNWNTASAVDMSFMFYGCSSLGEIDVSNWDVSKVTNFDHFAAHANLKRKGIENWKTTSATNMNALFHNCAEEELDLSGWDVSKVQFFCQMFENSPNLKRIKGLEKWNTSAGLGFDGMFERCYKLEEVDLSSFNTTKAKNGTKASTNGHTTATLQNMFLSCNNLKKVKLGSNFSINGDGTNTTAGNKLILPTPSTDYITGADGNWYAFNGDPYAPNAIQDKTAETYFASFPLCQNEDVIVKNGSLIDVAKAIKEKNGATAKYTPAQFGAAIRAL